MTDTHDRDDIIDVTVRYATAIDSRQWDLLSTVFADDAVLDYGEVGQWNGADAVIEFMELAHRGAQHTMHRMTNQVIAVDGDTAHARTYVDALILADGGAGVNAIGFYDDDLARTAAGWRITRRSFSQVRLVTVTG
jgi:ketosteroid isomerase-like protein